MKTAVIVPPSYLSHIGFQTGYHMALGQWLVKYPAYLDWYRTAHVRGDFIMVDNGAAEPEEERVSWTDVLMAANTINADEIVLPDVLRDGTATLKQTMLVAHQIPYKNRCIIPQGRIWSEWLDCFQKLHHELNGRYATIGIAKHLERLEGGRVEALRMLPDHVKLHYNIHLFGFYQAPHDEIKACRQTGLSIRGVDSGAPIAYAQNARWIGEGVHYSLDEYMKPDERFVNLNIDTLMGWCNE